MYSRGVAAGRVDEREQPETQTLDVTEAGRDFTHLINEVSRGDTRVVIETNGRPVAAIVPTADLERLNRYDEKRRQDTAAIASLREAFKDVDPEEVEREVVRAVREVRREDWEREQAARESA